MEPVVFLEEEHIDDDDCDYMSFASLDDCVKYIMKWDCSNYTISDSPINVSKEEYTFVPPEN